MTGPFQALSVETLPSRLGSLAALADRIGTDAAEWKVREVGDGNLNLVFIVEGAGGAAVVKQALPYVRLVGDSWPLPLKRSFFEYHALTRQEARAPGSVPAIYHFDEGQALIIMEYLAPPHIILRRALIEGRAAAEHRAATSACSWPARCSAAPTCRWWPRSARPIWRCSPTMSSSATSPRTWCSPIPISTPR